MGSWACFQTTQSNCSTKTTIRCWTGKREHKGSTMALPIRPVVGQFPSSAALWDDTSLPLAVTLQPLAGSDWRTTAKLDSSVASSLSSPPPPLSAIPKCLHCGAPHPTRFTYFHPSVVGRSSTIETFVKPTFFLCYLCGKVSSTNPEQQHAARSSQEEDVESVSFSAGRAGRTGNDSCVFSLPLRAFRSESSTQRKASGNQATSLGTAATAAPHPIYKVPAMACPILWFVVLDATATDSTYWRTVHDLLMESFDSATAADAPPPAHVHLSIILVSQRDCGIFQLDSPVSHLQQYSLESPVLKERLLESLVPMDGVHTAHTKTTLRSLLDFGSYQQHTSDAIEVLTSYDNIDENGDEDTFPSISSSGMPLGWILSTLSESLLQYGLSAGERIDAAENGSTMAPEFPYAGAQVSVLLGRPPNHNIPGGIERSFQESDPTTTPISTRGIFGGRALPGKLPTQSPQQRFRTATDGGENGFGRGGGTNNDWCPEDLEDRYPDDALNEWMTYYSDLGRQCVDAALAVDILGLATEEEEEDENNTNNINHDYDWFSCADWSRRVATGRRYIPFPRPKMR